MMEYILIVVVLVILFYLLFTLLDPSESNRLCPKCNWGRSSKYCYGCGSETEKQPKCNQCGKQYLPKIDKFCGQCGNQLAH